MTLPFDLRARVAFDPKLRQVVLRTFIRAIYAWLRRRARANGVVEPRCGSVTFEQRFSSDLRLNLHFHVLALDGVFSEFGAEPIFHEVGAPTEEELNHLARKIHLKIARILQREGWVDDEGRWEESAEEGPLELELAAASAAGRIASDARRGARVPPLDRVAPMDGSSPSQGRVSARSGGFDLHAAISVSADDRAGLERLCKYISRPPVATERMELTAEGKVRYNFRKAWRNGRTFVEFEPLEFLARLVALIPRPRFHLIHFHGVLAPRRGFAR